jgi:dienelactone hydrolase
MKPSTTLIALLSSLSIFVRAEDIRNQPLKDLNGYFPLNPPNSLSEWDARREEVKARIQVAAGLWPMPTKTPLNAVIHGKIDRGDYTIEKVYFESAPGFYCTGSLYRPKNITGKVPAVLSAHGHARDARLSLSSPEVTRRSIAEGAERFEKGGLSIYQSRCVQLARMGCVVWQWDMISDSDSIQIPREVVHTFAKQRPEMNTTEGWGFYSPQAEAHNQCILGVQLLNALRGIDFVLTLPEVDPTRIAMTGESGGGTQTMLASAMDDRIKLSFPVVMVSTAMQGGCTCENASLLRIGTGNIEFAALFAPKPMGMNTANDWTKELAAKGFPELQRVFDLYGKKDDVFLLRGEHFLHNYNAVTRSAFYTFLNKHFKLGQASPVIERDFEPLSREQLSVWDAQHPAPKAGDVEFERTLLKWFTQDAEKQLRAAASTDAGLQKVIRPAFETLIGRTYAQAGEVEWILNDKKDLGTHLEMSGSLHNKTHSEDISAVWLYPKSAAKSAVIWLSDKGTGAVTDPAVVQLVKNGAAVLCADLFQAGIKQTGVVGNPREFAGYTHGYNHSVFARRTHDVLSLISFVRNGKVGAHQNPSRVLLAGWESTGPVAVASKALAGAAVDRTAVDTKGFRFGKLLDYRDPMFIPGGAKYLDLPGLIALNAPGPLWLAGEGPKPEVFGAKFKELTPYPGGEGSKKVSAAEWLLKD